MKFTEDNTALILAIALVLLTLVGFSFWFPSVSWNTPSELYTDLQHFKIGEYAALIFFPFIIIVVAQYLKGEHFSIASLGAYGIVLLITFFAHIMAGYGPSKNLGLEVVIYSLLIGLAISNFFSLPVWIKPILQAELYIKVGLILLGCGILFGDVMKAGALGLLQSVIVVVAVWQFCFWVGKKFGLDNEFRTMLSSAVAICGVSAAIATSGVIKGDNKKLSYVISLVLITAIPMLLLMPYAAKALHLSAPVAGAWMGGTIDTTGAVVAAGNLLGEEGLKYATVVKFSQNVLLGIAAFAISIYWSYTNKVQQEKPTLKTIWGRFPKFVLGFICASLLFSFFLPSEMISTLKSPIKNIQTFWFAFAFTCIGLETKFSDLLKQENRNPTYVFLIAQVFNIALTLLVAWIIFR